MADLITLAEFKTAYGDTTSENDTKYQQAITLASDVIREYTDRSFDTTIVGATKLYEYDGSGILEIEDAATITSVAIDGITLTANQYFVEPYGKPPYSWLVLPPYLNQSPAMGFTWNLDTLWWKYLYAQRVQIVTVIGTWGWAAVPGSVKQAAIWTTASLAETPRPVIHESIEGMSRTYANPNRAAIPARALELLENWVRGRGLG